MPLGAGIRFTRQHYIAAAFRDSWWWQIPTQISTQRGDILEVKHRTSWSQPAVMAPEWSMTVAFQAGTETALSVVDVPTEPLTVIQSQRFFGRFLPDPRASRPPVALQPPHELLRVADVRVDRAGWIVLARFVGRGLHLVPPALQLVPQVGDGPSRFSYGFHLLRRHDRGSRDAVLGDHRYRSFRGGFGDKITQVASCFLDWQHIRHGMTFL